MLPPLKEKVLGDGLEPWSDDHSTVPFLSFLQQLTQLFCTHVSITLDLVRVGNHGNISLNEEDVVYLMLTPRIV